MRRFVEFVDKNSRKARKHLEILRKVFEKEGFPTVSYTEDEEPYIFVKNPTNNLSFNGIRIYKIGDIIAYRTQREEATHPYGKAYSLDIEDIFNDFIADDMKEKEAGKEVIKAIIKEVNNFFSKSAEAEDKLANGYFDKSISIDKSLTEKPGTVDYSVKVYNSKSYSLY